jgi:F-type H+-transporting ATPase subunit delta
MRNQQLASRYARALYTLVKEKNAQDEVFAQMRVVEEAFSLDPAITDFMTSPLIRPTDKLKAIEKLVQATQGMHEGLKNFLMLLAKKNRLAIFADVVNAYQVISDEAHGVTRGVVRSATVLDPAERQRISELVSKATKKQVILTYKEDPSLLGGLVAEVGSFTFDDSITSHLNRINEQLTRSIQ